MRGELARVGMERALMGGVFLTGGGAKLPDLCDVAERDAGMPGALRPDDRDSGLAGGDVRSGVERRRRAWRCIRRS